MFIGYPLQYDLGHCFQLVDTWMGLAFSLVASLSQNPHLNFCDAWVTSPSAVESFNTHFSHVLE